MPQLRKAVQQARQTAVVGLTDAELLACFLERRDEAAFAALVGRHAPMVWGVCSRLLNYHEAQDAFQAAFLVFFRKAASIRSAISSRAGSTAWRTRRHYTPDERSEGEMREKGRSQSCPSQQPTRTAGMTCAPSWTRS
jgi:hypothetical protein